jgi:hypothetical protein
MRPTSRFRSLAPSQCPRHSPASFIGGRVDGDEGTLFVGGEAGLEATPYSSSRREKGGQEPVKELNLDPLSTV